jgi:DNA-binding LacI/PurR family transcriptional regulator
VIGVIAPMAALYGPASMLTAFEEAAQDSGFAVNVSSVRTLDEQSIAAAVERHLDQFVAGLVVIAPAASAEEGLSQVPPDVPLITIDGDPEKSTTLVTVDQAAGARAATGHLLAAGHATVWHMAGPDRWFDAAGRIRGWEQALRAAGAEVPPILRGDWDAESGYRNGQVVARMPDVTAVFTANDHIALGLLRALHEHGRRVPEEISVVGFDDVPQAAYYSPPLTTVRADFEAVASAGVELLLARIESGSSATGERRIVAPTLITRDSVAAPPSR